MRVLKGNENVQVFPPLKAIRKKCLDCRCGHYSEVRDCDDQNCSLWPFRFGKRPETLDEVAPKTTSNHKADCQCPICQRMRTKS